MTQFIRVTTAPMPQPLPSPISQSSSSEDRLKVPQDRFNPSKYGSISSGHHASDTASIASSVNSDASFKTADYFFSMPATPPHTTVSPNDNDEGLYLLWTHQLLRERGYEPGRLGDDDDDDQEDNEHNNNQVKRPTEDAIMHDIDMDDHDDEEEAHDSDLESKSSSDSSLTENSIISGSLVATTPDLRLYSTFDDQSIRRRYSYSYKPSMSTSSFYASHRQEEEEQGSSFSRFFKSCFSSCQ
ncbi:predicted protein [Lichtheimia corymbifera JMRC:FSU:9682]|uniref:Uncharacterized protein n=1 Tax=Lichtheimia corymbifera JMRC:FSU:9682 TaxID=1263082 RepID=A0A068S7X7_9FUNG|nr:predicted protein [Lichtheimia corymbifera JMRC:FSU:9682]